MRPLVCAAAVAGVLLTYQAAFAASPEDTATARTLYNEGVTALDAHDVTLAHQRLSAAWALVQTPVIGLALAKAEVASGKLVEAHEVCMAIARLPVTAEETARSSAARKNADELATSLLPRLARLVVHSFPTATEVSIDGAVVPAAVLGVARLVNPGNHVVIAKTADGRTSKVEVVLGEGKLEEATIPALEPLPDAPPPDVHPPDRHPDPPPPVPHPPVEKPVATRPSPWAWVGFGTAAAGLAVGSITGAFALSEAATVRDVCNDQLCLPGEESHLHTARTLAAVSTVGFVVFGVGLAVGITGLVLRVPAPTHAAVTVWPVVGAGSLGVGGRF